MSSCGGWSARARARTRKVPRSTATLIILLKLTRLEVNQMRSIYKASPELNLASFAFKRPKYTVYYICAFRALLKRSSINTFPNKFVFSLVQFFHKVFPYGGKWKIPESLPMIGGGGALRKLERHVYRPLRAAYEILLAKSRYAVKRRGEFTKNCFGILRRRCVTRARARASLAAKI